MPINKNSLQSRINNLSAQTGVHQNILLKSFFFDAFLKRLSVSSCKERFVFKGGFLLSSVLGIQQRSTIDMDFLIRNMNLSENAMIETAKEVIGINVGDNVRFEFKGLDPIRQEDEYGGYRISLLGRLENIKEIVNIDIATGDPITPEAVGYQYKCLFDGEVLNFHAYNFETILAEKLQTILSRGVLNSRSKDYYDLFIIHKLRWKDIDKQILQMAFSATCAYRRTPFSRVSAIRIVENLKNDPQMEQRWNIYRRKNKFVGDTEFKDALDAVLSILEAACIGE